MSQNRPTDAGTDGNLCCTEAEAGEQKVSTVSASTESFTRR